MYRSQNHFFGSYSISAPEKMSRKSSKGSEKNKKFVISDAIKPIFDLQKIIPTITAENIDSIFQTIASLTEFNFEVVQSLAYLSQIYLDKFELILDLVYKLIQNNTQLGNLFLTDSTAYRLIKGLYDKGVYKLKDLANIRYTHAAYFFQNEFGYPETIVNYFAHFSEFDKSIGVDADHLIDKSIIYDGYPKDSIQYCIKTDDIDNFKIKFEKMKNLYKKSKNDETIFTAKFFVSPYEWFSCDRTNRPESIDVRKTLVQMAAFYGSPKIFKFLHENGAVLDDSVQYDAICGRNEDILLECDKEFNTLAVDNIILCAIKYHVPHLYLFCK